MSSPWCFPRTGVLAAAACAAVIIPFAVTAAAATARAVPPAPVSVETGKPVRRLLPNGMRLIVVSRPGSPLTAIDLRVRVGSANETVENSGIAHVIEHLVFKGTDKKQPYEIDGAMEILGGELSARTARDWTQYNTEIPSAAAKPALALIAEMLTRPAFRQTDLDTERPVIRAERAVTLSEPARAGFGDIAERVFRDDTGYALPLMGRDDTVARFTPDDLRAFWKTWYRPGNMTLTVVGDRNADEIAQAALALFPAPSQSAAGPVAATESRTEVTVIVPLGEVVRITPLQSTTASFTDRALCTVLMGFRTPGIRDEEKDLPAFDVLLYLLGNANGVSSAKGKSGRGLLYEALVDKEWAQEVKAEYVPGRRAGLFLLSATTTPRNAAAFDDRITAELRRLREDNVITDDLVKAAGRAVAGQVRFDDDTPDGLARRLGRLDTLGVSPVLGDNYAEAAEKVTTEDIKRVMLRYLTLRSYVVEVLGPASSEAVTAP